MEMKVHTDFIMTMANLCTWTSSDYFLAHFTSYDKFALASDSKARINLGRFITLKDE